MRRVTDLLGQQLLTSGAAPSTPSAPASCAPTPIRSVSAAIFPSSTATIPKTSSKPASPTPDIETKGTRFPKPEVLNEIFSLAVNTHKTVPEILEKQFSYFDQFSDKITDLGDPLHQTQARRQRDGFRRPAFTLAEVVAGQCRCARNVPAPLPVHPRGRVPGHEQAPGRPHRPPRRAASQRHGRRRRCPEHLRLAWREFPEHPRFSGTLSRARKSSRSRPITAARRRSCRSPTPPSRPTGTSLQKI